MPLQLASPEKTKCAQEYLLGFRQAARRQKQVGQAEKANTGVIGHVQVSKPLGGQAEDRTRPVLTIDGRRQAVVSAESSPSGGGAMSDAEPEAARPLRLLRDPRQQRGTGSLPVRGPSDLAEVAQSALRPRSDTKASTVPSGDQEG